MRMITPIYRIPPAETRARHRRFTQSSTTHLSLSNVSAYGDPNYEPYAPSTPEAQRKPSDR